MSAAVAELNRRLRSGAMNFINQACEAGQKTIVVKPNLAAAMEEELTEGFSAAEREALRGYLVRLGEALGARSPDLLEKLRAERLREWKRTQGRSAKSRGARPT